MYVIKYKFRRLIKIFYNGSYLRLLFIMSYVSHLAYVSHLYTALVGYDYFMR
jgi:hypothetical protein